MRLQFQTVPAIFISIHGDNVSAGLNTFGALPDAYSEKSVQRWLIIRSMCGISVSFSLVTFSDSLITPVSPPHKPGMLRRVVLKILQEPSGQMSNARRHL